MSEIRDIVTMRVIARAGGAIYLRLPKSLQEECGPCSCEYCKSHPAETPTWDTIAVSVKREKSHRNDWSWRLHMPDPFAFIEAMRKDSGDCSENKLTPASECGTLGE